jgi:hypothetical protein
MAGRSGSGWARNPRVLGVVAATLLIGALVVTGRVLNAGGPSPAPPAGSSGRAGTQAPRRVGAKMECPPGWPVLAVADHTSYPPGHPGEPAPAVAPVACYRTAAQAAGAGYPPAPLPPGAVEVGGVYLSPTSRAFRAGCRQAADRLGFAVPCPGLLPSLPPGAPPPRLCGDPVTCRRGQPLQLSQMGFQVPLGYVGLPGAMEPSGALLIVAAPVGDAAGGFAGPCPDERRIATPTVQGTRARLVACPEPGQASSYGGSVRLRWESRGTLTVVDLTGFSEVNQRLAVTLAERSPLVPPRR